MKWNIKSPFNLSDKGNFMGIELIPDGLKNANGLVKYPKEFEMI
jgi:predicted N-acetyltransferase YhbS